MEESNEQMMDNMTTDRGLSSKRSLRSETTGHSEPDKDKLIAMLNALIEINNDRILGYEAAIKETTEEDLKTLFIQFIQTSKKCKEELINEVQELGGIATAGSRLDGPFFRIWMDIKVVLTGQHRRTILNACAHGDMLVTGAYTYELNNALNNVGPELLISLKQQQELLKAQQDKITAMKDGAAEISQHWPH